MTAIKRAPLSAADKRECYGVLGRWVASRAMPVVGRTLTRSGLTMGESRTESPHPISLDEVVAGIAEDLVVTRRERGQAMPPRVGVFGKVGAGNLGNDASMEALLAYLERD